MPSFINEKAKQKIDTRPIQLKRENRSREPVSMLGGSWGNGWENSFCPRWIKIGGKDHEGKP